MRYLLICILVIISACQNHNDELKIDNNEPIYVEANGELASSQSITISPPQVLHQWQYKITFLIPEGTFVEQGQPIVGFDSSQLTQKLSEKNSQLNTAKKTFENTLLTTVEENEKQKLDLANAKMELEKSKRKWEQSKGLESNLQVQKLSIEYQIAKNEVKRTQRILVKSDETNRIKIEIEKTKVERIQNEVRQLQLDINKMNIKAPKKGIVIYKADGGGNKISSGDTVWRGRQLIELPSLDKLIVKAMILEADAGKIAIGDSVEVVLDAIPERAFKGKVSQLGQVFRRKSREQANIIFDAEITLRESNTELMRPGMATRVKIKSDS